MPECKFSGPNSVSCEGVVFYYEISKIALKIAIFWNHTGIVNHHKYTFPPFFWYRIPETFKISCTSWFQGRVIGFVAQNCSNEKFRIFHPRRYSAWKWKKSKKLKTWKSQNPWFVMVIFLQNLVFKTFKSIFVHFSKSHPNFSLRKKLQKWSAGFSWFSDIFT